MSLTFESAMILTRTISSPTAFEDDECRAYFDTLMTLEPGSLIVEVGLEYGRSSSIALQVAAERGLRYFGIDIAPTKEWFERLAVIADSIGNRFGGSFGLESAKVEIYGPISAILIDGDHSYKGVLADCEHFLPHVIKGGYAMFHDYERESLPEVTRAVHDYLISRRSEWKFVSLVGTLGIWRRM